MLTTTTEQTRKIVKNKERLLQDASLQRGTLPTTLVELCESLGAEMAAEVWDMFRGQTVYVPKQMQMSAVLNKLSGATAQTLVTKFGGSTLVVPVAANLARRERDVEIRKKSRVGVSVCDLAKSYNLHERTIRSIISRIN